MKKYISALGTFFCMIIMFNNADGQTNTAPMTLKTIYDGRTPCRYFAEYLNEPVREECIKIKWRLILYREKENSLSGSYELTGFVFRRDKPTTGNWETVKGYAADPEAEMIRINIAGRPPILLLKLDDNVLFFLDKNNEPLAGNRDFSYTLNRMKEEIISKK